MWALRAAIQRGLRVFRPRRRVGFPALQSPPWSARALAAGRREGADRGGTRGGHDRKHEEEEEEEDDEDEVEDLLSREPLLPPGAQRVCIVHPEVTTPGSGRAPPHAAACAVGEASALVGTLDGWSVTQTLTVPARSAHDGKVVFGKGTLRSLTETIRACPRTTAVFLDVERVSAPTREELEAAWRVPVMDRFSVVLHIFRCHARTREARLQVALAQLPLLRSRWRQERGGQDEAGRGSRYIMGSGETPRQARERRVREEERRLRRALERLRGRRRLLWGQRERRQLPVVSVVGYTNCGKTTLVKALTGDASLEPRDQPFSTLDVTAHAGTLPSRAPVLYVDTIGFLSRLPHGLLHAFAATMDDLARSDVLLHVRDVSHPEWERQGSTVLSTLRDLRLPPMLLDSMLEVHNKVDLAPGYCPPGPRSVAVSALLGHGLDTLKAAVEDAVQRATGTRVVTLRVRLAGPQLSWLHREAAVQHVDVFPEAGDARVTAIMSPAAYGRFRKLFPDVAETS